MINMQQLNKVNGEVVGWQIAKPTSSSPSLSLTLPIILQKSYLCNILLFSLSIFSLLSYQSLLEMKLLSLRNKR